MDVNIPDLIRQVSEQELITMSAVRARNRAQEVSYEEERKLADLKHRLFLAKSVSESPTDTRSLLNG